MENKKLKYILYARKSTEAKERQMLSIAEQKAECQKIAKRDNLDIVLTLEEAKTSFKPNVRPVFNEMIEMLKSGEADAILTWKPNRLTRNPTEGGLILQLLQDGAIKEIRTASGEVYTSESDQLVLNIHFGMSNEYSRGISKDVRRAMQYKAERGEYFRKAPYGYENFGEIKGKRNIRPKSKEAQIVQEVFKMASSGNYSLKALSNHMFANGITTKTGKAIANETVRKLLKNPVYYGWFTYKGDLYKGDFDPIITKELFDKVQSVRSAKSSPNVSTWAHTYNGLLKCGECGCSISTTVKSKKYKGTNRVANYTYHRCTHKRDNCKQPPITTDDLENMFNNYLSRIYIDEEVWELGIELLKAKHKHESSKDIGKIDALQRELRSLREQKSNLIQLRASNEITADELKTEKKVLVDQEVALENTIKDYTDSNDSWLENTEDFLDTCFEAKEIMNGDDLAKKKELITKVGSNLTLKDRKLDMTFKKPYDVLLRVDPRLSWQGRKESNPQ